MPNESYAKTLSRLSFRSTALATNIEELPHLVQPLDRLNVLLERAYDLSTQQAALTAAKQEVSKQLRELILEGRQLVTFLDAGVRLHYGNRAEKLVEFGQQPFRGQPRVRIVGPDGQPLARD